jgi:DNA-binding response OmpR family regulator
VLVVEDEPAAATALQDVLVHSSCDVEVVGTAEAALKSLGESWFSLAIVDLALPGMDGASLLGRMAQDPNWARIPAIIVSGQSAVLPYNAVAYLRKPIQGDELLALLKRHARR